jgi:hypothetical protein
LHSLAKTDAETTKLGRHQRSIPSCLGYYRRDAHWPANSAIQGMEKIPSSNLLPMVLQGFPDSWCLLVHSPPRIASISSVLQKPDMAMSSRRLDDQDSPWWVSIGLWAFCE